LSDVPNDVYLYFIDNGPTTFSLPPGEYLLGAEYRPDSGLAAPSDVPVVTCTAREADGTAITVVPHMSAVNVSQNAWINNGNPEYSWTFASLTVTQLNPSLFCSGDWDSLDMHITLAPPGRTDWASAFSDSSVPSPFGCSLDNPQTIASENATGLAFGQAYLLGPAGLVFCLSRPQPFTVPIGSAVPPGTPMVLTLTSQYVHPPQPVRTPSDWSLAQGLLAAVTATSGGTPVTGIDAYVGSVRIDSLTDPILPTGSDSQPPVQTLAYAGADPSDLTVTLTFTVANVTDWSMVATFRLS